MSKPILTIAGCEDGCQTLREATEATFRKAEDALVNLNADNFKPGVIDKDFVDKTFSTDAFTEIHSNTQGEWKWIFAVSGIPIAIEYNPVTVLGDAQNFVTIPATSPVGIYRTFPGNATIFLADPNDWENAPDPMFVGQIPASYSCMRKANVYAHWVNSDSGTSGDKLLGSFDDGKCVVRLPDWTNIVWIGYPDWYVAPDWDIYGSYYPGGTAPCLYVATPILYDYRPPWIRNAT